MSITETIDFDKDGEPVRNGFFRKLFMPGVILLSAVIDFGAGRLSAGQGSGGVSISFDPSLAAFSSSTPAAAEAASPASSPQTGSSEVYASSKGTKYYYSDCKSNISAANKIAFASTKAAEAAGYSLAANCHK